MILRTRDCHIEKTAFLLLSSGFLQGAGERHHPFAAPDHEHRHPFQSLRLVNGGKHDAVFDTPFRTALFRYAGQKRQFTQKILESGKPGGKVCQLEEIFLSGGGIGILFPQKIAISVFQNDVDELRRAGAARAMEGAEGFLKSAETRNGSLGGASLEILC